MTPFQQLRIWSRHAPVVHRAMAAAATILICALAAWLVIPVDNGAGSSNVESLGSRAGAVPGSESPAQGQQDATPQEATPQEATPQGTTPQGSPGVGAAGTTGGTSGGSTPSNAPATARTQQCPATVDQGVTDSEIKVAITIISIAGAYGNGLLSVPTPEEQEQEWKLVADNINASGGVACRKLALRYYSVNPIDANDAQAKCLAIAADRPFLVVDSGALTGGLGSPDCVAQQKIPLVSTYLGSDQLAKYFPYFMSALDIPENVARNGILALKQGGYFSSQKGFEKLGVMDYSCKKNQIDGMRRALKEAGVPESQIIHYDMGCPASGQYTAADQQQAVLTFKNAHVTHVTYAGVNGSGFGDFTTAAQQQNYKPQYVLADSALPSQKSGDPQNLDGAIDVVGGRYGEEKTPGFKSTGGTAQCNAIFTAAGLPPVYQQQVGYGGVVCHYLFFVQRLLKLAPQLRRDALAPSMRSIGYYDGSFPFGPADFAAAPAGSARGAGYWRFDTYSASCSCWRVPDPKFQASFK